MKQRIRLRRFVFTMAPRAKLTNDSVLRVWREQKSKCKEERGRGKGRESTKQAPCWIWVNLMTLRSWPELKTRRQKLSWQKHPGALRTIFLEDIKWINFHVTLSDIWWWFKFLAAVYCEYFQPFFRAGVPRLSAAFWWCYFHSRSWETNGHRQSCWVTGCC